MADPTRDQQLAAIASIQDPSRRALFDFVGRSRAPVGRDEAAAATGLPRATAAFHLDRLVKSGLLTTTFARRTGRTGPGSGRPAKLYSRTASEVWIAVPDRHYDLAGDLLASAIEASVLSGEAVGDALTSVARARGRLLGEQAGSMSAVLDQLGYEPLPDGAGRVILANCPFHRLAEDHRNTVCSANLALLQGTAEATTDAGPAVQFDPGAGRCCVSLITADEPAIQAPSAAS